MQLVEECYSCIIKRTNGILLRNNIDLELQNKIINEVTIVNRSLNSSDSWLSNKKNKICPAQLGSNRQQILELNQLGNTYQEEERRKVEQEQRRADENRKQAEAEEAIKEDYERGS